MTLDELRSLPYANEGTPQEYACVPTVEFHCLLSDREDLIAMKAVDDREYDERVRRDRRERIATAVFAQAFSGAWMGSDAAMAVFAKQAWRAADALIATENEK